MNKNEYSEEDMYNTMIKIGAEALARRQALDKNRVINVFHRLAEINWLAPDFPWFSALDKAFYFVEPSKALELFENEDLIRLAFRVSLIEYFNDITIPFYSLEELAKLTEEFISHLYSNRTHLIKTGFPETSFEKSRWLDWHLNKLYYVKLPLFHPVVKHVAETRISLELLNRNFRGSSSIKINTHGNFQYDYAWAKETLPLGFRKNLGGGELISRSELFWGEEGPTTFDGEALTICEYEDAAFIDGLSQEDANRLEKMRSKLFDLKVNILKRLQQAISSRSKKGLWNECRLIIENTLTADEVDFLLHIDHLFAELLAGGELIYSTNHDEIIHKNAGLSDLFEVIGHFHKEIEIGTMDETCKALAEIPFESSVDSYYIAVGEPWQEELDFALYLFSKLEAREKIFWEDYSERVNNMLNSSLQVSNESVPDSCRDIPRFDIFAKQFAKWLEQEGKAPPITSLADALMIQGIEYEFKKRGDYWNIIYEGDSVLLKNRVGLKYISYLLAHPGREFHVLDLFSLVKGTDTSDYAKIYREMTKEQLEEEGLGDTEGIGAEDLADTQARKEYHNRIKELDEDIQEAEENINPAKVEQLKEEKQELLDYLEEYYGIGSRSRKFNSPTEKARKAVSNAVSRAIESIKVDLPRLATHLDNSIQKGTFLAYNPEREIAWNL